MFFGRGTVLGDAMKLGARIGPELRRVLDARAAADGKTPTQLARHLAVFEAAIRSGETPTAALEMAVSENARLAVREAEARAYHEKHHPDVQFGRPSPRALASDGSKPQGTITVKFSAERGALVETFGFADLLRAALTR